MRSLDLAKRGLDRVQETASFDDEDVELVHGLDRGGAGNVLQEDDITEEVTGC